MDALNEIQRAGSEFTVDKLRISEDKSTNQIKERVLKYLVQAGLIKEVNGRFIKTNEFDKFVKFIKEGGFKGSVSRVVAWAIWYLYNKGLNCFELSQILDILPSIDAVAVKRALKRLKLKFKRRCWCLSDETIPSVLEHARGKISNWWPFFGTYYVRDMKFFKIAHEVSYRIYADFPIDLIYDYI